MKYVYTIIPYAIAWFLAFGFWSVVESFFHLHRWSKWKQYEIDKSTIAQTRQYRICKNCEKMQDEHVSYCVVKREEAK